MVYGHWDTSIIGDFDPVDYWGFTYIIENLDTNKKYIGRKQFRSIRRKKLANRKNRMVVVDDSDWKTYTGSSVKLNEDIEKLGESRFRFTILKLCKTKGTLNYAEAEAQFRNRVLLTEDWYNDSIRCRIHSGHVRNAKTSAP